MVDIVLPSRRGGLTLAVPAAVFEEGKELAWEAAKERIVPRPDMGWLIAKYIDLSPPDNLRPNRNGHIFLLEDGIKNHKMVIDTPMNWLHHERLIVGHYVDADVMHHLTDLEAAQQREEPAVTPPGAHVETLSTFYREIYPDQWQKVKDAHAEGMLFQSMEARPEEITCMKDGCCGQTYKFAGCWSETYCDSLQSLDREFIAHNPLFLGGAVVPPGHSPGWAGARSVEVASWTAAHQDEAATLLEQIKAAGDLDDQRAEEVMTALLDAAGVGEGEGSRSFHFDLPKDLTLPTVDDVRRMFTAKDREIMDELLRRALGDDTPAPTADTAIEILAVIDKDAVGVARLRAEVGIDAFVQVARTETLQAVLSSDRLSALVVIPVYQALIDRTFTAEQRRELAEKGQAMPDGSFPTPTKADWYNARAAVGRATADARSSVIAYLKKRASALGIPAEDIPDTWS